MTETSLKQRLESLLQSDSARTLASLPVWRDYWSDGSERVFRDSGLMELNQKFGYH